MKLFESVPNFSEGRDAAKIEAIAAAARTVPGVRLLDVESNADHNRSVISLVGEGDSLVEAVFRMMQVAVATLDLRTHVGEHPRMGATDVVPFIPLGEATVAEAVRLSERLGERVARELGVPVYLYAQSARVPERSDLAVVRKGQFEGLRETIASDPARKPDFGESKVHPTGGAVAIGARPVLIAYNVYLDTPDVSVAKKIAKAVRARDGGLPEVKALGFEITERHQAQVSMNLTDYHTTPIPRIVEAVRGEAAKLGARSVESEIVGLVPNDALLDAAESYLQLTHFDRRQILEQRLQEDAPSISRPLAAGSITEFARRLSERTPTPGGGSAAAAAAAMGAALGAMVLRYSQPKDGPDPALDAAIGALSADRDALLAAIDDDTEAYEGLRTARRAQKSAPDSSAAAEAYRAAVRRATEVPLVTARTAATAARRLESLRATVKRSIESDLTTALALLNAGCVGALSNVAINLPDLESAGGDGGAIRAEARALGMP
ncbi:MAG: glutamate formimidoyltransferase [Thermoplasmata archaeon]|nr:glutamate formimidoyltransferase [Thermoplasmata archaeon]